MVPTLVDGDSVLTQSIPIMEYLEETYPETPILPADATGRARVRAIAQVMVSDTHPLGTARVIEYIDETLGQEKKALDRMAEALERTRVRGRRMDVRRWSNPRRLLPR